VGFGFTACGGSASSTAFSVTTTEPAAGKVAMAAPDSVKAGVVKVSFKNGGKQPHDALFVRVEGNHPAQEVVDVLSSQDAPPPDWARLGGGVSTVGPGQTATATVNLAPGSYYLVDTQGDDNGDSFAEAGGIRPLQVTGSASKSALPAVDATITAQEYSFGVPTNLKAGTNTIRFQNNGSQPHMLVAVPIAEGKTLADVKAVLSANEPPPGPPPVDFDKATGAQGIDGGSSLVTTINLQKGTYAFVCFLNNRGGGPPHFTLGMLQEVRVA
jgi:plastocyanin